MRAAVLWLLLVLFVGRVLGQLAVAVGIAPFLPPMEAWYSGLLSYRPLLISQGVIIIAFTRVCVDLSRGRGYFSEPRQWLASSTWVFGWLYAAAMAARYAITMTMYPERRWTGGTIPIVFHFVLAGFLLVLSDYHRRALSSR